MDLYVVLGLPPEASVADVKRAYRRLSRRYHPDLNPGDDTAAMVYRHVSEAYGILSDPVRKRQYDAGQAPPAAPPAIAFQGFDFSALAEGRRAGTFSELFAEMFQPPAPAPVPRGGSELHADLSLTYQQALRGGDYAVRVTRQEPCAECDGAGARARDEVRCARCQGVGTVRWARGHMVFSKDCVSCGGSGRLRRHPCSACGALGVYPRTETLTIPVPPRATDGQVIRMPGEGHAGAGGRGHLYVHVRVAPHEAFRREGLDLNITVPVAVHEAALGARIDVPTLEGTARLKVPPGTQSGQRFRMRGRGIPSASGESGDLIVEVRLVLPDTLTDESRALLEAFARLHPDDVRKELFA